MGESSITPFEVKSLSEWRERDSVAERAIKEIEIADDRSAAIVAAAFFEDYLTDAIAAVAQQDEKLLIEIFRPDSVSGSFGAKIRIGFLLGLYDVVLRKELDVISKIRNRFAHRRVANSFQADIIRGQVINLVAGERIHIVITAVGKSKGSPDIRTGIIYKPIKAGMSLRERYVATCYMFLQIFVAEQVGFRHISPAFKVTGKADSSLVPEKE